MPNLTHTPHPQVKDVLLGKLPVAELGFPRTADDIEVKHVAPGAHVDFLFFWFPLAHSLRVVSLFSITHSLPLVYLFSITRLLYRLYLCFPFDIILNYLTRLLPCPCPPPPKKTQP